WGVNALGGTISEPAWRTKPSWYLLTTDDKMIPPAAQRLMAKRAGATVVEVKASHAIFVSQPQAVASVIEKAAKACRRRQHASRWSAPNHVDRGYGSAYQRSRPLNINLKWGKSWQELLCASPPLSWQRWSALSPVRTQPRLRHPNIMIRHRAST